MSDDLDRQVINVAFEHAKQRAPLDVAASAVVNVVRQQFPKGMDLAFVSQTMEESVDALAEQVEALLQNDPPKKSVNGLWFGLCEMIAGDDDETFEELPPAGSFITLYLAGSTEFDRDEKNPDWPCNPAWFPDERYMQCPVLLELNNLRPEVVDDDTFELSVNIMELLIQPILLLCVVELIRRAEPKLLLGKAPFRGVAFGTDEGAIFDLGIITPTGIELASSLESDEEEDD